MATPKLVYVSDEKAGFSRQRKGRGFTYLDEAGNRIENAVEMERIQSLVIPPAWKDVWISPTKVGHIQATGRDIKDRKQYIYHPEFKAFWQQKKFDKLLDFAERLPNFRQASEADLRLNGWPKQKVLALISKVLDQYFIRIGNVQYKDENDSYGLTTLRRKHLLIHQNGIQFSYMGKSKQFQEVSIEDKKLIRLIKECSELPGYEVFRYQLNASQTEVVDSMEVNEYIRQHMGEQFSSKDFRTWGGTTLAVEYYEQAKQQSEKEDKKLIPLLVNMVAEDLGNTVSVCREFYIHPRVLTKAEEGTIPAIKDFLKLKPKKRFKDLTDFERLSCAIISAKK